jgi:hypothetical protein
LVRETYFWNIKLINITLVISKYLHLYVVKYINSSKWNRNIKNKFLFHGLVYKFLTLTQILLRTDIPHGVLIRQPLRHVSFTCSIHTVLQAEGLHSSLRYSDNVHSSSYKSLPYHIPVILELYTFVWSERYISHKNTAFQVWKILECACGCRRTSSNE